MGAQTVYPKLVPLAGAALILAGCATTRSADAESTICRPDQYTVLAGRALTKPGADAIERPVRLRIAGERLAAVDPAEGPAADPCLIDLSDTVAMPGLWDMHVHITKSGKGALRLFVANGVTAVRDMGGDPTEIFATRAAVNSGTVVGPHMRTSGPMIESAESIKGALERGSTEDFSKTRKIVSTPAQGRQAVRELKALGVDFIKVRSTPDDATYLAILDEAARKGLRVAGHARESYPPVEAARHGQATFEHAFYPFPLSELGEDGISALAAALVEHDAAEVPTLSAWRFFTEPVSEIEAALADTAGSDDPRNATLTPELRSNWQEYVEDNRNTKRNFAAWKNYVEMAGNDIGRLHDAGVQVFAGTDTAVPMVYPGSSLIDELLLLHEWAHLSNGEALAANTWQAAAFLGEHERGELRAGQMADVIFLRADPRLDLNNLRQIEAVILRGRYFSHDDLEALLAAPAVE